MDIHLSLSFIGDQSDPNIDEDLMREYEEFVQDFEDHLMMQEFGQTWRQQLEKKPLNC